MTAAAPAGKPVAGVDYPFIEITESMEPSEKRNARIANSKARSAAMKAFKEARGSTVPAETVDASPGLGEEPGEQIAESIRFKNRMFAQTRTEREIDSHV